MPRCGALVADASPLISLEKLPGGFSLLAHACSQLLIPAPVAEEVSYALAEGEDYFEKHGAHEVVEVEVVPASTITVSEDLDPEQLGLGERYAIALAEARQVPLMIEERKGRRVARALGLQIFGAAALIKIAFEEGGIDSHQAGDLLRALYRADRINRKVFLRMVEAIEP
jgi:predicted nucleic acid-binding protein